MSQTDKGVLIFSEWFEAMKCLKATDFKRLMLAIYRFQIFDEEPPEFEGKAGMIASIIFPVIRRRMELSEYGSRGAAKRLSAIREKSKNDGYEGELATSEESSHPEGDPESQAESQAISPLEAKEKNRKEKKRIAYSPSSESSKGDAREARGARGARGGRAAKSEEDKKWDEFFAAAIKRALGES